MKRARDVYAIVLCICWFVTGIRTSKPNIVVIIADDLGWNDVGFHGSNEIPTPNLDALAYNGIILNRHYVLPTCTPSRAALMTGRYPIRTGLQGDPGRAHEPWGLPLNEKILPQYLKEQGYKTHLVGKWHLGFAKLASTPTKRGFDSHFGFYNGWIRYNESVVGWPPFIGLDARRNLEPAADEFRGRYATDVLTDEALAVIEKHDEGSPLFLEVSHVAVHALKNNVLQVRDEKKNDEDFHYIVDKERRLLAGTLRAFDESVGKIIEALKNKKLLDNSIILFMSDNGGATEDPNWSFRNSASNWPLRGMKTSIYEGGVRGAAAIWSPLFTRKNYVSNELFHITDWLPTFLSAAGGDTSTLDTIDGINQWQLLTGTQQKSERHEILVNVNQEQHTSAIIIDTWKLIKNNKTHKPSYAEKYAGATGRQEPPPYDVQNILTTTTNRLLSDTSPITANSVLEIRAEANIDSQCQQRISSLVVFDDIKCTTECLYNLETDPCEFCDVARDHPNIVKRLKTRLEYYESVTVPQQRFKSDPRANPTHWNGYWCSWLDEGSTSTSSTLARDVFIFGATFFVFRKLRNVLNVL